MWLQVCLESRKCPGWVQIYWKIVPSTWTGDGKSTVADVMMLAIVGQSSVVHLVVISLKLTKIDPTRSYCGTVLGSRHRWCCCRSQILSWRSRGEIFGFQIQNTKFRLSARPPSTTVISLHLPVLWAVVNTVRRSELVDYNRPLRWRRQSHTGGWPASFLQCAIRVFMLYKFSWNRAGKHEVYYLARTTAGWQDIVFDHQLAAPCSGHTAVFVIIRQHSNADKRYWYRNSVCPSVTLRYCIKVP